MIRNEHVIIDDTVHIYVYSSKYGKIVVTMDFEDLPLIKDRRVYVWSTNRHSSLYALVQVENGRALRLHRIITKAPEGLIVDHINGMALDNRKINLRTTTQANNNKNAKKRNNAKSSKYKGVHFSKREGKWKSQIQLNGMKKALGTFSTEIEAAKAYNNAATTLHGEFARLNNLKDAK